MRYCSSRAVAWSLAATSILAAASVARAEPSDPTTSVPPALIGAAKIPGGILDRSGLTESMEGGLPANLVATFGSGLVATGQNNLYFAIADRGPADGDSDFHDRFHLLRIDVHPAGADGEMDPVTVTVEQTQLLSDPARGGLAYTGSKAAFNAEDQDAGSRLDPEAIAISPRGTIWTADEYGPWIDEWTTRGTHLRRIETPEKFRITHPAADPKGEMPPHNTSGRQANRGLEGLAFSTDGQRLFAIMQSPLIQDGALNDTGKRVGVNIRMLELSFDDKDQPAGWREFVYTLDSGSFGVNELTAISNDSFLVIEKDGKPGEAARARRIYRVEISGENGEASDVSGIASLPATGLPDGVRPVTKHLVLDMLDPRYGLTGRTMPEKVEGLALGPVLPDGRRVLIIASDNDYVLEEPSWVWAFSIDPRDLQ